MTTNTQETSVEEHIQNLISSASEIAYKATSSCSLETEAWKDKWHEVYDKNLIKLVVEECAKQLCDPKFRDSADENKVLVGQGLILNHFGVK